MEYRQWGRDDWTEDNWTEMDRDVMMQKWGKRMDWARMREAEDM
jgi:hypothetical protein